MKKIYIIFLLTLSILTGSAQTVLQLEYFIDIDAGIGNNTLVNVMPAADDAFPFVVNVTGLSAGYHKLYIRSKDSDGKWSLATRRTIEVPNTPDPNKLDSGEYFLDSDPGYGNAIPLSISPKNEIILQSFTAATNSLVPGFHRLYIRLKDFYGRWSHTVRYLIEVIQENATIQVTGAEYFFNTDPGVGRAPYISFVAPQADGTFTFIIPQNQVTNGLDTLYLRVKDSTNKNWSLTGWTIKNFTINDCTVNTWTGMISADWHNPGNWTCNTVPDETTEVIINSGTPFICEVLSGNSAVCRKITANSGSNVKLNTGSTLAVNGN